MQNSFPTLSGLSVLAEIRLCAFGCQKLNNGLYHICSPCLLEKLCVAQSSDRPWDGGILLFRICLVCSGSTRARSGFQSDKAVLVEACGPAHQCPQAQCPQCPHAFKASNVMELNSMLDMRSGRSDML